ncbi:5694_t:CDS:2 [Ambispora leptoticha]|uniref:5694_t:CDS:1 n=1 Tax=Ambispora leptoticha TaxID=144679 RepID=A0A9N8ZBG8_9GLOM|nr:5694_t:CDS:2 [Ambispora leptoticha]
MLISNDTFASLTSNIESGKLIVNGTEEAEAEEIKEWHFHVYFFQENEKSKESALALRRKIIELIREGFFHPVPYASFNMVPMGPHPIGSYEVWCPKEHFARVFSWFVLNRGQHSVLVHPLTVEEMKDHAERAVWMGTPMPLDTKWLAERLPQVPLQYPELKMGYSAPTSSHS